MSYCVGILVDEGLVLVSDSRTNAGIDRVSTFQKTFVFEKRGERVFGLICAGNLSITQSVTSIIVTHDMITAQKVADRVVMLYPLSQLEPRESQIIFDGSSKEIMNSKDKRVSQFVRGEAGERLEEMEKAVSY